MNNENYSEYSDGIIIEWVGKSENELITSIAIEHNIPRNQLVSKINELKSIRYNGPLTFWQILDIAIQLKSGSI